MRVLLIYHDRSSSRYLRRGLIELGHVVTLCESAAAGLTHSLSGRYDLILLNPGAEAANAANLLRRMRGAGARVPVIVISSPVNVHERVGWFEAGCDDYVVKPFAFSELAARISALERRKQDRFVSTLSYCGLVMNTIKRTVSIDGRLVNLTNKEYVLLQTFLKEPERVFTKVELLDLVWGPDCDSSSNVLEVYVRYLRRKLEGGQAGPMVQTIRGVGYALRCEPRPHDRALPLKESNLPLMSA